MTTITRFRGDTVPDRVTVKDSTGTVIDISGYTFLLTVNSNKEPTSSAGQLMQITGVVTDGTHGLVEFSPTSDQANQAPGKYFYDIQMTTDTGKIQTIVCGTYVFKQDITK